MHNQEILVHVSIISRAPKLFIYYISRASSNAPAINTHKNLYQTVKWIPIHLSERREYSHEKR